MMFDRACLALALLTLPACETALPSHPPRDANTEQDAPSDVPDARSDFDADTLDSGPMDLDGGPGMGGGHDAGWGTCVSGGVLGTCLSVTECGAGYAPVAGLCPGPVDIQCCLPATDAGATPDAGPRPDASAPGTITPADVLARLGACARIGGDYAKDVGGAANIPVCQTSNVIWWTADMDIDCDGGRGAVCMADPDYLPDTSAVDSTGAPLDASTLPFIVIPLASASFRYADYGIRAGQIALVLYGDRMVFGIFGDAGPASIIGEASFAMAEALGIPSNPSSGGVDSGVTYLVFTDATARVTHNEDHAEAVSLGEPLLAAFVGP